jgi:hypothetical protein
MTAFALLLALAYPGAPLVPISGEDAQRLAYFTTADPPGAVAAFYVRRWRTDGFPSFAQREPSRGAVVAAALSTRDGTLVAVIAGRVAPGRTLAFLVVRSLWAGPEGAPPR